jgi:hypothetical protein
VFRRWRASIRLGARTVLGARIDGATRPVLVEFSRSFRAIVIIGCILAVVSVIS